MTKSKILLASLSLSALAGPLYAQSTLGKYVAVGDSLTAGYTNGSLVESRQTSAFPNLIAGAIGLSGFEQPWIAEPGIPAELVLSQLLPTTQIAPKSASPGAPKNTALTRAYDNLGVPGATALDCLTRTSDNGGFHDLILRKQGTAVAQATSLAPGLVTLWIGNNDVLGAVVAGRTVDGETLTPAPVFKETYEKILAALVPTGATIVAANLPDVTVIPFVTTIPTYVADPTTRQPMLVDGQKVALVGPTGPLPPGSYVTLAASSLLAQGYGIPSSLGGNGKPLPDNVILDPAEIATLTERVRTNNAAIAQLCAAAGVSVVDMNAVLGQISKTGRSYGGIRLTSAFLTGGMFSFDGIHPTATGYAVVANEFIAAINAKRKTQIPPVDIGAILGIGAAARSHGVVLHSASQPFEFTPEAWGALALAFPPVDRP